MRRFILSTLAFAGSLALLVLGCGGEGDQQPWPQQQVAPGYPGQQPQPVAPGYPTQQPQPAVPTYPIQPQPAMPAAPAPAPAPVAPVAPAPIVAPPAPAPAAVPPVAAPSTPATCRVSTFTQPTKIGSQVRHMGQREHDFAANQGYSALIFGDIGGPFDSDAIKIHVIDGQGRVVGKRETVAERLEWGPAMVAAPWGGFVAAYRWSTDPNNEPDRIAARTIGYDGNWSDGGWVISGRAHNKGLRLRNLGDRVGVWWHQRTPDGKKTIPSYVNLVNRVRQEAAYPGLPTTPLQDPTWRPKLEAVPGWPIPAGTKGVRIRWDGSRFVVSWKTVGQGGHLFVYKWLAANCG